MMGQDAQLHRELELLHPACWGWALACCMRDADEAAETLQSAYVRILEGRARFGGRSSLRTWVFGVIRMVARERRLKAVRRARRESEAAAGIRDTVTEQTSDWDASEPSADELVAALKALSCRQREVLDLVFYQGLTIEEAAEVMRITIGTARTHYERGKQRLRQLLSSPQEVR